MKKPTRYLLRIIRLLFVCLPALNIPLNAQSRELTPDNMDKAIREASDNIKADPMRPAVHLTPPAGCMGDPNGGIYHDGWYHIFYGLYPFAHHPGGWYWAHARSQNLLHWEHMKTGLIPAFRLDLRSVGSGFALITEKGEKLAFYSSGKGDASMQFWQAQFTDDALSEWKYEGKNPVVATVITIASAFLQRQNKFVFYSLLLDAVFPASRIVISRLGNLPIQTEMLTWNSASLPENWTAMHHLKI